MHGKEKVKSNRPQKGQARMHWTRDSEFESADGVTSDTETVSEDKYSRALLEKWSDLVVGVSASKKTAVWERAGILPRFVRALFDNVEASCGIHISTDDRKMYYSKFLTKASGSTTLTSLEMEKLLSDLGLSTSIQESRSQIQQVLERNRASLETIEEVEYDTDRLDFEVFVCVLCELHKLASKPTDQSKNSSKAIISQLLPIDPDSTTKQGWDIFCLMLLFYCSFSVPYGIAFLDSDAAGLSVLDMFGLAVDMIFMCDILLSFVTSIEVDGIVVRDLRIISTTYTRWLRNSSSLARRPPTSPSPALDCTAGGMADSGHRCGLSSNFSPSPENVAVRFVCPDFRYSLPLLLLPRSLLVFPSPPPSPSPSPSNSLSSLPPCLPPSPSAILTPKSYDYLLI